MSTPPANVVDRARAVVERAQAGEAPQTLELISGANIKPEPIRWLWQDWLAHGKVHIVAGAPGTGKTTVAMAVAAQITSGGKFPDGSRCECGNVVMWSGEDTPSDVLLPRFIANGGDTARLSFVGELHRGAERLAFDPARDMPLLRAAVSRLPGGVAMLIVDPVVSAVSGDSHKNAEVRRGLQPLGELAAETGCAVLGITHFSKGTAGADPVERVTGSVAFGAVARLVWATAKEADSPDNARILIRAKSNIGPDGGGFGYVITQHALLDYPDISASVVGWRGAVEGAARDLLAKSDPGGDPGERSALAEAEDFLRDALAEGPVATTDVQKQADLAGVARATLRRAKERLGVRVGKGGMKGGWYWSLPPDADAGDGRRCSTEAEDAHSPGVSAFGGIEHLQGPATEPEAF